MSKTLTEIAQIISNIEDDLYDKADEMLAQQQRIRELEAALEQSKERLSAARVKYEQPMMAKALGLQKRVERLEAALRDLIETAMKAMENKP